MMRSSIIAKAVLCMLVISMIPLVSTSPHAMSASTADKATLENIARGYLLGNAASFGVQGSIPEIQLSKINEAPSYYITRFDQIYNGLRVYNTTALVMISKEGLRAVDAVTKFKSLTKIIESKIDAQTALTAATAAIAETVTLRGSPKAEQVLYVVEAPVIQSSTGERIVPHETLATPQVARVCWQVNIPALEPLGDWAILVDGPTGKIISKQNLIVFDSGEGWVYRYSNPIQTGGNSAWPAPDDLDHDILTQQETNGLPPNNPIQLLHLASGTGQLVGDFVDLTAPGISGGYKTAGLADEPNRIYHYTRADDKFEEVMVYYYVDSMHSYLQQIGEVWLLNYPVPAHAHYGAFVNAFYSSSDLGLHFGDGVGTQYPDLPFDLAEDADVIIHEYGHAIHGDQGLFNGWVSEEMGAFSEGFSDYLGASFLDQGVTPQGCLAEWFGYELDYTPANPYSSYPYCMRDTFSTKHYPEDMTGEVHADGEMWSAALWQLRGLLGKGTTDRLAIETGYYLWPSASFRDAVKAMIQVDRTAYAGAHESAIRQVFRDNGMLTYWIGSQAYPWGPYWNWPINIRVEDRGFENGWGTSWGIGWTDPSVTPQIVSSPVYAGYYAAELVGSASLATESSIYYEFTMPNDATWVSLRFRYRIDTTDSSTYDWFEWRLGTPSWYWVGSWLWDTGGEFYYARYDIPVTSDLRGQTCRLTFLLHDDGAPLDPTYVYLDGDGWNDISLRWSNLHAPITINGETQDTPRPTFPPEFSKRIPDGTGVSISAPSEVKVGGLTYRFMQWSDGQLNPAHPSFTPTQDWYSEAQYYASSWSGWERLAGATLSAPTIVYDSYDGRVHMFVRGTDNGIYHNSWQSGVPGGWAGWERIPGATSDQPAAAVDSDGNLHLVVVGTDGKFYHTFQPPGFSWNPFHQIGSAFTGTSASLAATSTGRIDLVIRTSQSGIRHNYWLTSSGQWQYDAPLSGWDNPGGGTPERPVLAYDSSIDTLYLFVRGTNNVIYHNDLAVSTNTWSGWYQLPGATLAAPAVVADAGRVDLFVRGTDNGVYHGYRVSTEAPSTLHWEQLPGGTLDTPAEAYRFTNVGTMLEVVVRGTDSGIYHNTLDLQTQKWSDWTRIPGGTSSTPALLVNPDWNDEMYLDVRGTDNGIYFASIIVWVGPPP